jgi:cysteine sulfinate desulfinase/cysteine desulfurase-like protein
MIEDDVVCSQASACKAVGGDRSHVLDAIGAEDVGATVRLGLGSCNGPEDAQRAAETIVDLAQKLHGTYPPPPWPGAKP